MLYVIWFLLLLTMGVVLFFVLRSFDPDIFVPEPKKKQNAPAAPPDKKKPDSS
ncbi:hypothetical protein [Aneurinibacillus sp. REN35]|uniref:hypothetical protein n=1 Tax=Aneurinibacillus sp. REN35 TaxID=3237286 RepID=UPI003528AD51